MSVAQRFALGSGRQRPAYEPKSLNCPNCGAGLTVQDEHAELIVCSSCQSHLDLSVGDTKALSQTKSDEDWGFQLAIGDPWIDGDHMYEVVARMVYAEEEQYITRQYLLFSPRLGSFWASEYHGEWTVSRSTRVLPEVDPFALEDGAYLRTGNGRSWRKTESGHMELKWVEGALPWKAQIGDTLQYAEFRGNGDAFFEAQRVHNELEYGDGRRLSATELADAAGIKPRSRTAGEKDPTADADKRVTSGCRGMLITVALFILVPLIAAPMIAFFGSMSNYTLSRATEVVAKHESMRKDSQTLQQRLTALVADSPGLFAGEEQPMLATLKRKLGALNDAQPRVKTMRELIEVDRGWDEDELLQHMYAVNQQLEKIESEGQNIRSTLDYVAQIQNNPKSFTTATERNYSLLRRDATRAMLVAEKALEDWSERKNKIQRPLGKVAALLQSTEKQWEASRDARRTAHLGKAKGAQLRQVLLFNNAVVSAKDKVKKLDLERLVAQLYWASEAVLVDMNVKRRGDSLLFQQKLSTLWIRAGEKGPRPQVREKWRTVNRSTFMRHQKHLGMSLQHKPLGRFNSEQVKTVGIPGLAQMCAPECGKNDFGSWQGAGDERHWVFAPAYAWIASSFWPSEFVMTEAEYANSAKAAVSKSTFFGQATGGQPYFGSSAATMLALYAAGAYAANRGFNVPRMEQRLRHEVYQRQQSYRSSSSSGSRSGGGK
jgi:hypothetical protein